MKLYFCKACKTRVDDPYKCGNCGSEEIKITGGYILEKLIKPVFSNGFDHYRKLAYARIVCATIIIIVALLMGQNFRVVTAWLEIEVESQQTPQLFIVVLIVIPALFIIYKDDIISFLKSLADRAIPKSSTIQIFSRRHDSKGIEAFESLDDILIEYVGDSEDVVIPSSIRILEGGCFKGKDIKSVTIPASVEFIGYEQPNSPKNTGAFESCVELEEIHIEKGSRIKEIGRYAFAGCSMLRIINGLPNEIEIIRARAFKDCGLDPNRVDQIKNSANTLEPD